MRRRRNSNWRPNSETNCPIDSEFDCPTNDHSKSRNFVSAGKCDCWMSVAVEFECVGWNRIGSLTGTDWFVGSVAAMADIAGWTNTATAAYRVARETAGGS